MRLSRLVVLIGLLAAISMAACDRLPQLQAPESPRPAAPSPSAQPTGPAPPPAAKPAAPKPSGANPPQFVGGFKEFHDLAAELIGEPVRNEYSPWPGMSLQQTTNGTLIWVENHDLIFVTADGRTFTWDPNTHALKIFVPQ